MSDKYLRIAVTFPGAESKVGLTKHEGPMTTEIVNGFIPDTRHVSRAIEKMESHGFSVSSRSHISVSMFGSKEDYEKLFDTELVKTWLTVKEDGVDQYSFYYPRLDARWNEKHSLNQLIDEANIQWPLILLGQRFPRGVSMFPPFKVGYHHFRVPTDIALSLNASKVHREGTTGKGIKVAMIDTGFNFSHPFYGENGYNTNVSLAARATEKEKDSDGHGTAMAANLLAVAPGIEFIGIKLNNETDRNLNSSLKEGFDAALKSKPNIISISVGSDLVDPRISPSYNRKHINYLPNNLKALEADIVKAVADGITIVCAAGNGHVSFPGMMNDVIAAGGVFLDCNGQMHASDFCSAYTSKIYSSRNVPDLCGVVGLAKKPDGHIMLPVQSRSTQDWSHARRDLTAANDGWSVISGTSAAAPQIAGICALLLEKDPSLKPNELKQLLKNSSRDVTSGSPNIASNEWKKLYASDSVDLATGAGLADAYAAYRMI